MKKAEAMSLLKLPLTELLGIADRTRSDLAGNNLELCSIINAKSGRCPEDCKFCAQSAHHKTNIDTYPLKDTSQIIAAAKEAKRIGAKKFGIVTSGNRLTQKEIETIAAAITEIKNDLGIEPCASLGALEKTQLKMLKDAGLTRYHHNIETSPSFYAKIVSTHSFDQRVTTIEAAKDVGLQVCSGGIIGMGETFEDRVDMALLLKDLDVDSIPINILVPIEGTALESAPPISCVDAIKTICLFRIILRDKTIKIAAGRESVLKDFQSLAFLAGANGMLIGGYLTVKGRDVAEDHKLVEQVQKLWTQ